MKCLHIKFRKSEGLFIYGKVSITVTRHIQLLFYQFIAGIRSK